MITAAVLAGGLGTRLRAVLGERPKVLARIGERYFLAYLLDQLLDAGISKVVLCTGYGADQVERSFGHSFRGLELQYSRENEPLGTAGALRAALPLFDSDPVLVLNGDSYCNVHFAAFFGWHDNKRARASVVLVEVPDASRFGTVRLTSDGEVVRFEEKGQRGRGWINAGIYLLSRSLLETIREGVPVSLERECFPGWVGKGLYGYATEESFLDIGTPAAYQQAEEFFAFTGRQEGPSRRRISEKAPHGNGRRFVLLDRDGTINVERNYLTDPAEVELLPGAVEGLRRLQSAGLGLVVITNQSAVGRGLLDGTRLEQIHRRLQELLRRQQVTLDGVYSCPHTPDENCTCRKPNPGLIERAATELGFDPREAFVIGDKTCDVELGRRVGATTFLVRTGYGAMETERGTVRPDFIVSDLAEAAGIVVGLAAAQQQNLARAN